MPDASVAKTSLHRIDLDKESIGDRVTITENNDFDDYVSNLIEDMYDSNRYKSYKFSSNETEVARQVLEMNEEMWEEKSQIISERLLRSEKLAQERLKEFTHLRVGSLVQLLGRVDGKNILIVTKVDHNAYLDEENLKKHLGLPIHQRVQKTAIFSYEDKNTLGDIRLSDTNKKISQYWWKDFLEVEELKSSESNTLTAFNAIDNVLRKDVRRKSKSDFWTLRNAVISYFRTNENCTFDTLISSIFDEYSPDHSELDMEDVKKKISDLPNKYKFDSQFEISSSSIKAKIKNQIQLAENLELKITGHIDNLEKLIDTGIAESGRKYIRIFSESGYSEFSKETETTK